MIDLIATILSMVGGIFIAKKNVGGYYLWIISNILWVIYGISTNQISIVITFLFFLVITAYGIYEWKIKGIK